ncbi:MAG: AsmA-like C-terminal region-containing protein [Roseivirga sp.]
MTKIWQVIRKLLAALCLLLGGLVVATGVYCYSYRDQIIQRFLTEANQQLSHPVQIGTIQLTALRSFPNVTLILHEVAVQDGPRGATDLLTAREMYCTLDVLQLLQGNYVLSHLSLAHGRLCLGTGLADQLTWKQGQPATPQRQEALTLRLQKVTLRDMEIVYSGQEQHCAIRAVQMQASLRWTHAQLEADLRGQGRLQRLQWQDWAWVQDLPVSLRASLRYDQQKATWTLCAAQVQQGSSRLTAAGSGGTTPAAPMALTLQGQKVNPKLLLSCLPKRYQQALAPYDLRGSFAWKMAIRRAQGKSLSLEGEFALHEGTLAVGQLTRPIALPKLLGHLRVPNVQHLKTAQLGIDELTGTLAGSELVGSLVVRNFDNPYLQCTARATADLATLAPLLTMPTIKEASGQLNWEGQLEANLQQLVRGAYNKEEVHLSGTLQAQAIQLKWGEAQLPCKELTGRLVLRNNVLLMKDCSGSLGSGRFVLNGTVNHLLPYLWGGSSRLGVEAKLYADHLDLDTLLPNTSPKTPGADASFDLPAQWTLKLDCDIKKLSFRRFQGKNVRGCVKLKEQKLVANNVQLGFAGGKVALDGTLDARQERLGLYTQGQLQGVQIARLFDALENFHQDFLVDRHLQGDMLADFAFTLQADRLWNFHWETLQADINARLKNGALLDFEPMQQLTQYVTEETLANLRFSELKNHIHIQDKTIYLPPMEIHSNVTHIQLSGTHTFDGKIDYDLVVPFSSFQQSKQAGAVEEVGVDALAGINLFLKLQGDVNRYAITYDTKALKRSLKEKWQAQGKALKEILQGKYQRKKQHQELASDDYFEFDE